MAELEKVIKCLELCRKFTSSCEGCPYENVPAVENCMLTMHCDALELLKEQEHKDRMYRALEDDWKRLKELLKEQEAKLKFLDALYNYVNPNDMEQYMQMYRSLPVPSDGR